MKQKFWLFVLVWLIAQPMSADQTLKLEAEDFAGEEVASLDPSGLMKVGEEVVWTLSSPPVSEIDKSGGTQLLWEEEVSYPGATYIAVHFSDFNLPDGAFLVVQHPDWRVRSWTYRGKGKKASNRDDEGGFWAVHIPGDLAKVQLFSEVEIKADAVQIDRFAWGYEAWNDLTGVVVDKAICGTDNSVWAQCQTGNIYNKSKAVARLLIGGSSACTGWLVGSEGHLMTNEHCISTQSVAGNTDYEFMAEGGCSTNCASWGACPGTVVATSGTLIQDDADLDYALILLPGNPSATYGYLRMRSTAPAVGENIYIPQHPQAWGKKIASCTVSGFTNGCSSSSYLDVGYYCDTQGGSSGSPVIATSDDAVVALHHCANCPNRGVPIHRVLADLNTVPTNATGAPPPPPPPSGGLCGPFNSGFCTYRLSKPDLCCLPTETAPGAFCPLICF